MTKRIIIESPYNPGMEQITSRMTGPRRDADGWELGYSAEADRMFARKQLLRENIQYCRLLYKKALEEGHAPFASHLNYTQVWSEEPGFRERGIEAGLAWKDAADEVWYGCDLPWSESLRKTHEDDVEFRGPVHSVLLFPEWNESQVRAHLASLPWVAFVGVA